MDRKISRLCLVSLVAFIAGAYFGYFFGLFVMPHLITKLFLLDRNIQKEAVPFFYRTMNSLFEGTYNPEDGSIPEAFLEVFEESEDQLGGKCRLFVLDKKSGYYECFAYFPSGDVFSLVIVREKDRWVLEGFRHKDWEDFWRDVKRRYKIESKDM